jgi:hypothetical protein
VSFVRQSIGEVPPPLYTLQTIVLLFFIVYTFYFFQYFLLLLDQVVLLLITSTFTRVQIQSNLGTTGRVRVDDALTDCYESATLISGRVYQYGDVDR